MVPVKGGGEFPVHRIYCVGRNYVEHAQEMGHTGREPPFFFTKPADAVVYVPEGETGRIDYPSLTKNLHHEIELVVAIGKGGRDIKASDALACIWGYARGPGHDAPRPAERGQEAGPAMVHRQGLRPGLADRTICARSRKPASSRAARSRSRSTARSSRRATCRKLIWNVGEIIEHLSSGWALQPGDLIFTGTPAGVAAVVKGDVMEGEIAGLGTLKVAVG